MDQVRNLLGWGQTKDKDEALTTAGTHGSEVYFDRNSLSVKWLDDNDVGWLLVVLNPDNIENVSDRLRNSERTAHLILHDYLALGKCGPAIRNNKRMWLSALACTPTDYPSGRLFKWIDVDLQNDPAITLAWYHRFVVNELTRQRVPYDINSSIHALELYLQEVVMKMTETNKHLAPLQAEYKDIQSLITKKHMAKQRRIPI